ncbi:hypothetical protein G9A89_016957 [Geosiphon pyriformis]|nr:hypothetical protein G9A89_016957 [Geosiphon pyriformis]
MNSTNKEGATLTLCSVESSNKKSDKLLVETDPDELVKIHIEIAIKHLRVTQATPDEQKAELLQFIAKKERKIIDLKEELAQHEEELRLLKERWDSIVNTKENETASLLSASSTVSSSTSSITSDEDDKKINGALLGSDTKDIMKEKTSSYFTDVKIAENNGGKPTKRRLDFRKSTWGNLGKSISALARSDTLKNMRRKTMGTVNNVERSVHDSLVVQSDTVNRPASEYIWSPVEEVFNRSDINILQDDEFFGHELLMISSPTRETTHILGDDFGDLL